MTDLDHVRETKLNPLMSDKPFEEVVVTIHIDMPELTAVDFASFMMTEADREHGEYSRLVPDARERWRWLYRTARETRRNTNEVEPPVAVRR